VAHALLGAFGMNRQAEELKARTAAFARAVIALCEGASNTVAVRKVVAQLIDSATSVAANYRAACRARSRAEFVAMMAVVREVADESEGWLAMLRDMNALPRDAVEPWRHEASELTAIANASYMTAKRRLDDERRRRRGDG
jgi:four helix bundle protein